MKKYLTLFIALFIVFGVNIKSIGAEDSPNRPNFGLKDLREQKLEERKEFKDERKELWEERKGNMEEWREEWKTEREAFVDGLKDKREAFKDEVKARKEEWKIANAEMKARFCEKAKEMITRRFQSAIEQLEKYQTKVGEIIVKLDTEGLDTTLAEEALDLSKQKLADAKTKLLEVKALVPDSCENMTPEIFEQIKLGAREAKDLLKESREALHQAIKEIRILKGEDGGEDDSDDGNGGDNQ